MRKKKNLARCTFDYFPVDDVDGTQMAMKAGDIVTLISTEDEEWWEVSNQKGDSGFIPKTYVELLVDAKQKRVCKALFDFIGKTPTELSISVGDLIHLISTEDDEWYEGRLNEKVGFFPKNHVEIVPTTTEELQPPQRPKLSSLASLKDLAKRIKKEKKDKKEKKEVDKKEKDKLEKKEKDKLEKEKKEIEKKEKVEMVNKNQER